MRKEIGPIFRGVFFAAAVMVGVMVVTNVGVDRQEQVECIEWRDQAQKYPDYFLLWWQKAQCDARGIVINAVVKK